MNLTDYLTKKGKVARGKTDWLLFATLEIKKGGLWAGDPHLPNADDGCVVKVPRGTYVVEAQARSVEGERIVARLRVRLESADETTLGEQVGESGTDSALIGVSEIAAFEAAYKKPGGAEAVQRAIDEHTEDQDCGILRVAEFPDAVMPFVPIGTDGTGPVFCLRSGRKVVGIELPFMDEPELE